MADKDYDPNENHDESGESGRSGSSGSKVKIHLPSDARREDQLSPNELRRLLRVHEDLHKTRVDRQRRLRAERQERKEGPQNLTTQRRYGIAQGGSSGTVSPYKKHWLSTTAQFSGIDRQTTPVPGDSLQENTNEDMRNELQNRLENKLQNQLRLTHDKKFIPPTPRPY